MPCDTQLEPGETISQRKQTILEAIKDLSTALASNRVRVKIGPTGAVAFEGWEPAERRKITDACAYRRIMATGSALAKAKIASAEALSGRSINREAVAHGHHSHDGGKSWHNHKG